MADGTSGSRGAAAPVNAAGIPDAVVTVVAASVLVVGAVIYPVVADSADHPLTLFAVPPVIAALFGSVRRTVTIAAASMVVALVEGSWDSPATGTLFSRLAVVVVIAALAVAGATLRARTLRRLTAASEAAALHRAFQRGLAPTVAPPPSFSVSSRYIPGEQRMHLGGDFFDVIALPNGDLAFAIGDVAGHGPYEAAFGAAMRAGWKSAAYSAPTRPLDWLHLLATAFFEDGRFDGFVTMCTGRVETATGRAEMVSAGHVWPVVIRGRASVIPMRVGPPLSPDLPREWTITPMTFEPGDVLVLYTDGLTENRAGKSRERWGEDALIDWLNDRVCSNPGWHPDVDDIVTAFSADGHFSDDVAVLLIEAAGRSATDGRG